MTILQIVFWVLLADSILANIVAWTRLRKRINSIKFFKRYIPVTRGWTFVYTALVLMMGYLLYLN